MTGLLFDIPAPDAPDIPGLQYLPDFITAEEGRALIEAIDQQPCPKIHCHCIETTLKNCSHGLKRVYQGRTLSSLIMRQLLTQTPSM